MGKSKSRSQSKSKSGSKSKAKPHGGRKPLWSGTISFGLVTVPVELFSVVRSTGVRLRMLSEDGVPLERRYFCPKEGRELSRDEIVRGFETDDGTLVPFEDDELEQALPRKSRDMDLSRFVALDEVDPFRFENAYALGPSGQSTKAYRLLAETLERDGRVGIATFVMRDKEHLVAIFGRGGRLWAETLRYAGGVRSADDVGLPESGEEARPMVKRLVSAIRALEAPAIDPDELVDERTRALERLVAKKREAGSDVLEAPSTKRRERSESTETPKPAGSNGRDLFRVIRGRLEHSSDGEALDGNSSNGEALDGNSSNGEALESLTKAELYRRASELGVEGRSSMKKAELIEALRQHA